MLSVIIPTLYAEQHLPHCLAALAPAAAEGLVCEIIVSDGGSADETAPMAKAAGARLLTGARGRGGQLARGAAAARGQWLLFLHADTVLEPAWDAEARAFMAGGEKRAGVFTLAFAGGGIASGIVARGAMLRTRIFRLPYGDQGLLISRALHDAIGGYADMPLFEDVDIVDRLVRHGGRRALRILKSRATTSPVRYARGHGRRIVKNALCLALYRLGVAPERIVAHYA